MFNKIFFIKKKCKPNYCACNWVETPPHRRVGDGDQTLCGLVGGSGSGSETHTL